MDGAGGETGKRLERVLEGMREEGLQALLVRSTDRYLNEYVPARESLREWLTGFRGSVGDALVVDGRVALFVDGRYYLQAEREADPRHVDVVRVPYGTTIEEAVLGRLGERGRARPGLRIGYEPEKVSVDFRGRLRSVVSEAGGELLEPRENLVARARGPLPALPVKGLEAIPEDLTGESAEARLGRLRQVLDGRGLRGLLVTRLDQIAWLTNLRGYEIDYASTFRAVAYVDRGAAVLYVDPAKLAGPARAALRGFDAEPEEGWERRLEERLARGEAARVLLDPEGATEAARRALAAALGGRGEVCLEPSPIPGLQARKNVREIETMRAGFRRADRVVSETISWLNRRIARGRRLSELDLAREVEARFRAAGARGLSFRTIAAAGANGAIIHYSHPDPKRLILPGELVLLDTGAYFEAGYATDLTRTFLAGGSSARPSREQKHVYTLVLRASLKGLMARFPAGTTAAQLDAIVREPIWQAGYDYLHGTGHGVGVLVHEFPPWLRARSSEPLAAGMVFSIEPGIYREGWGGVRIENLVTLVEDPKAPGYLCVEPLTFCPLDRRLLEPRVLSVSEKRWLRRWARGFEPRGPKGAEGP